MMDMCTFEAAFRPWAFINDVQPKLLWRYVKANYSEAVHDEKCVAMRLLPATCDDAIAVKSAAVTSNTLYGPVPWPPQHSLLEYANGIITDLVFSPT